MDLFSGGLLIGAVVGVGAGVIGGILGPLCLVLLLPPRRCPDCGEAFPRLRRAGACRACGCVIDRRGRKVEE